MYIKFMLKSKFVNFFYIGLETLPAELQRNFQLMRQLDQRSEDLKVGIECSL